MSHEIIPVTAEQSRTVNDDEHNHNANKALDTNFGTCSYAVDGEGGKIWWKANLGQVHCVDRINEYLASGSQSRAFSCTGTGNSCVCDSGSCNGPYVATVVTETDTSYPASLSDCKYGDTVKLDSSAGFPLYEVVITKKPGLGTNNSFLMSILEHLITRKHLIT